jgi:hypothetical protein
MSIRHIFLQVKSEEFHADEKGPASKMIILIFGLLCAKEEILGIQVLGAHNANLMHEVVMGQLPISMEEGTVVKVKACGRHALLH